MSMIRIRVPLVRPLVRFNLKRILRVLPSILLLLFVFSLIFVTLMQIAMIHSHRRTHILPARQEVTNLTHTSYPTVQSYSAQSIAKSIVPGMNPTKLPVHKRPETLRVEAFLDKTAPSVEANVAIIQNIRNTVRVKYIMNTLSSMKSMDFCGKSSSASDKSHSRIHAQKLTDSSRRLNLNSECLSHRLDNERKTRKKPMCPSVPRLAGRLKVDLTSRNRTDVEDLLRRSPYMRGRGSWTPANCTARHRVGIIIPYRDRLEHLSTLLFTLHPLLQRQLLEYRIFVVEQQGNDTFNKGVLMNAGVREALKLSDFHCFVFHDVDMIPEDDRNTYSCPPMPRHLSVAVDKFNYTLPYSLLVGGVFAIRVEHFLTVNGYSNLYWGWGGEDDDMAYRIKYRKLEIVRPPESLARYTMIKHDHRPESPNAIRTALLRMAKKRSPRDGLNTAKYRVVFNHDHLPYTHLMIDIGNHHRWQFLNGQRLIINF